MPDNIEVQFGSDPLAGDSASNAIFQKTGEFMDPQLHNRLRRSDDLIRLRGGFAKGFAASSKYIAFHIHGFEYKDMPGTSAVLVFSATDGTLLHFISLRPLNIGDSVSAWPLVALADSGEKLVIGGGQGYIVFDGQYYDRQRLLQIHDLSDVVAEPVIASLPTSVPTFVFSFD